MNDIEFKFRQQLAATYRLIHYFKWDDLIYTHVSAKIPGTDQFLINNYGLMFNEITASNLVKVDINGKVLDSSGIINPAGFVIHSAIHSARSDVHCIVHTHTVEGVAVSANATGLLPISQQSVMILPELGYHEYQGIAVDDSERTLLQKNLTNNQFLILRNHGLLTVGESIPRAFLNMYMLQRACEIQVNCDLKNVQLISDKIVKSAQSRTESFNQTTPPGLAWKALIRLLDSIDSSYKD